MIAILSKSGSVIAIMVSTNRGELGLQSLRDSEWNISFGLVSEDRLNLPAADLS